MSQRKLLSTNKWPDIGGKLRIEKLPPPFFLRSTHDLEQVAPLARVLLQYFHTSLQSTPFKVVYGHDPPPIIRYGSPRSLMASVDQLLEERDRMLQTLKDHFHKAQVNIKQRADKHKRGAIWGRGMSVLLTQNISSIIFSQEAKWEACTSLLRPIQDPKIDLVAYHLDLPNTATIHPIFHVSLLRRAMGHSRLNQPLLAILDEGLCWKVSPESGLDMRHTTTGQEALIQWEGLPSFKATGEPPNIIQQQFLTFNLEYKVVTAGGRVLIASP